MIKIIDNAIPESIFEKLRDAVHDKNFPWFFMPTTSYQEHEYPMPEKNRVVSYCYTHMIVDTKYSKDNTRKVQILDDKIFQNIKTIYANCFVKHGIQFNHIERMRLNSIENVGSNAIHPPHIDLNRPHMNSILYFDDTDGNTIIYNEKLDLEVCSTGLEYFNTFLNQKVTVKQEIEPKRNRMVCFDGLHYHTGQNPTSKNRRVVLVCNFM